MSNARPVVFFDGRREQSAAPAVRRSIALKKQDIGQAFYDGSIELAKRRCIDLFEYETLNRKFLTPSWPAVRLR